MSLVLKMCLWSLCAFVGRSVCAFVTRERRRFIWSPFSFLRPWHTHALHCWEGRFLKAMRKSLQINTQSTGLHFEISLCQGDGNIRYYEISSEKPYIHYLTEYRSHLPQKGMGKKHTPLNQTPVCSTFHLTGSVCFKMWLLITAQTQPTFWPCWLSCACKQSCWANKSVRFE